MKKIDRYVEAYRELAALKHAKADEPERAQDFRWKAHYTAAKVEMLNAYGALTGGQLAQAQRALRNGRGRDE
jgi:hypothetical protein